MNLLKDTIMQHNNKGKLMAQEEIQAANNEVANLDSYHEIVFHVACEQEYLHEIFMQGIADSILEHGDGVEFIENDLIIQDTKCIKN